MLSHELVIGSTGSHSSSSSMTHQFSSATSFEERVSISFFNSGVSFCELPFALIRLA
jgi:hypothetical protein